ncbi:hypothetical protein, partial [Alistipes putredinis]|uniref:hypothetical protein n=1 Tax=Alistipes putredinis TaxID=28117 RepID=UPI003AB7E99F
SNRHILSEKTADEQQRTKSYYVNHKKSIGIEFEIIKPITPIGLEELKKVDSKFHPPQIYRYVTNEEITIALSQKIK